MPIMDQSVTDQATLPVYSRNLVCHHPTTSNPEVLKAFTLALLKGEGYCTGSQQEHCEELLIGEHILMIMVPNAAHTGLAVVTARSPVEYFFGYDEDSKEAKSISLFVALAITEEAHDVESLTGKIQSWDEDHLLTDRIGQATFEHVWANITGEKQLPSVASEFLYKKYTVQEDREQVNHAAKSLVALARQFNCTIELRNVTKRTKFVKARSITAVLSLGMKSGHEMEMRCAGEYADKAILTLEQELEKAKQSKLRHMAKSHV